MAGCSGSTSTISARPRPLTVGPDTPVDVVIARMHEAETDCVLVTVDDRLVGIFTDRDAVVKAAGKRIDAFHVRDFMTPDPVDPAP